MQLRLLLSLLLVPLAAQAQAPTQPSMQDGLASAVRELGSCQSQLGALRTLQADVIQGKYLDWQTIKQQIELANPALVLDLATHKLLPKPDKSKEAEQK